MGGRRQDGRERGKRGSKNERTEREIAEDSETRKRTYKAKWQEER